MSSLDNLHNVRTQLGQLSINGKFKKLLDDLPQVCTFGAQSSGKSSVIKRMTGISMPSATGTCSRIATHILSRRGDIDKIKITLQHTVNLNNIEYIYETTNKNDPIIELSLRKAQNRAIQLSQAKSFVTDYVINVYVTGSQILNSNLVDLPGFNTDNIQDRLTVENICKKYLEMDGTIALHVCRADVDHNVQAGNDIIKSYPNLKKILVLTYCDNVHDEKIREIMTKTITSNSKYKKISVCGNFAGPYEDEESVLNSLVGMFSIGHGTKVLNTEVEQLMNIHIGKQLPILKSELSSELSKNILELGELTNECPLDVLLKIFQKLEKNLLESKNKVENDIRLLLENMKYEIVNSHIKVRGGGKIYDPNVDEPLQNGMMIDIRMIKGIKKEQVIEKATGFVPALTNIVSGQLGHYDKKTGFTPYTQALEHGEWSGQSKISSVKSGIVILEGNPTEYNIKDCEISIKENDKTTVVEKIKEIINVNRGIVNINHTDIQPAIEFFADGFAREYGRILETYSKKINDVIMRFIDEIFANDMNLEFHVMDAVNRKKSDFLDIMNLNKEKFLERVKELVACNMKPLVYSSSEFTLNIVYNEMVKGKNFDSDDGIYEQIYYKAKAYLKEQKKYVIEDATKKAILILYHNNFTQIKSAIYNNLSEYSQRIEMPAERQIRINELKRNISVMQSVLKLL